jgi:hypothetical protein
MSIGKVLAIITMIGLGAISVFTVHQFKNLKIEHQNSLNKERQKNKDDYFRSNKANIIAEIDYYIEKGFAAPAKYQIEEYSKYNYLDLSYSIMNYCEKFSSYKLGDHEINDKDCETNTRDAKRKIKEKKEYIASIVDSIDRKSAFIFLEGRYPHIHKEIKNKLGFPSVFNVNKTWVRPVDNGGVLVVISYDAISNGSVSTFVALVEAKISGSTLEAQSIIPHSEEIKNIIHLLPQTI